MFITRKKEKYANIVFCRSVERRRNTYCIIFDQLARNLTAARFIATRGDRQGVETGLQYSRYVHTLRHPESLKVHFLSTFVAALAAHERNAKSCSYGSPLFLSMLFFIHVHVPQLL